MGLSVTIGSLADAVKHDQEAAEMLREAFAAVNEVLRENNLPVHTEPQQLPKILSRSDTNLGYSYLHHLRRFYAHAVHDPSRELQDTNPLEDPVLIEETNKMSSHLLCHSDAEGFYLPIDFKDVIADNGSRIPGGFLGSSCRLMEELVFLAPTLGVELQGASLTDTEANKILDRFYAATNTAETGWRHRIMRTKQQSILETHLIEDPILVNVKMAWLTLFESARLSIEYRSAICFF